jgi:hypothetical protein
MNLTVVSPCKRASSKGRQSQQPFGYPGLDQEVFK